MERNSLIKSIYLYTFSLLGLVLIVIGGVNFIDMALKAYVFTQAEQDSYYKAPSMPYNLEVVESLKDNESLTEEEKAIVERWFSNYEEWEEQNEKIDPLTSRRHEKASRNLALILIGLPLYLYHWKIIRREVGKNNN
jgi:hypothetical protein